FPMGKLGNGLLPIAPAGAPLVAEATDIVFGIGIPAQVFKPWDIDAVGLPSLIVFIFKSIKFAICANPQMVVHDVSSQLIGIVAHAIWKAIRFGLHQNGSRGYGGSAEEDHLRLELELFFCQPIDYLYAGGPFGIGIVDNLGNDG